MIRLPPFTSRSTVFRKHDIIGRIKSRTDCFKSTFYPHCLTKSNKLDPELRLALSFSVFKKKILSNIHPPAKSVFGICDSKGLPHHTQLGFGLSKLNFHKFEHNFRGTINPMCSASNEIEDTKHLLLLCLSLKLKE